MKIDWKRKLTSRKLWIAAAGFVAGLIAAFGGSSETAETVSGCILSGAAVVGYVIGEKYWNQGIVTDALQEAIYHYFTYTNTIRIFALVFEHNLPSMRVLEKAGFNKVGIMTKSIFKNGHFTNAHLFELLKNV